MTKKFIRNIENFSCERCKTKVIGDGYTNHCPNCLTSKHVDINPGDRLATCGGIMPTVRIEGQGGNWVLVQTCERCGFSRKQNASHKDNQDAIIAAASSAAHY